MNGISIIIHFFTKIMVILVFFLVISVNRRLFRYFGSYSGISVIPVILVNRRTGLHLLFPLESSTTNTKMAASGKRIVYVGKITFYAYVLDSNLFYRVTLIIKQLFMGSLKNI